MPPYKCLIVDDEPIAREIIKTYVQAAGNPEVVAACAAP
jgi:CheY-like chemotaxis protein